MASSSSSDSNSFRHPAAATAAAAAAAAADAEPVDLSKLTATQLISYLLRGPNPPSSENPEDLVAVVRELSAREAQHKAVVAENEALRRQSSVRKMKEEIQGHFKAALSEIHEVHEEGAFQLEAMLSGSKRSGALQEEEEEEAVVSELFAGQKKRLGKIAREARAKVNASFNKVIAASAGTGTTSARGRGRGRGRGRRGISLSPAQARAAAAVTYTMPENLRGAPKSTTVQVGRSSICFLRRAGKAPVVETMDSEEERHGLREEEANIRAMEKTRDRMRAAADDTSSAVKVQIRVVDSGCTS